MSAGARNRYWQTTCTSVYPSVILAKFQRAPVERPDGITELIVDVVLHPSSFELTTQAHVVGSITQTALHFSTTYSGHARIPLELNEIRHYMDVQLYLGTNVDSWQPSALTTQVSNICMQANITDSACARLSAEVEAIQDWVHIESRSERFCAPLTFNRLADQGVMVCVNLTDTANVGCPMHHCKQIQAMTESFEMRHAQPGHTYVAQTYVQIPSTLRGQVGISDIATLSFTLDPVQITSPRHGANVLSTGFDVEWTAAAGMHDPICIYINGTERTCVANDTATFSVRDIASGPMTLYVFTSAGVSAAISLHVMDEATAVHVAFVTACDEVYMQNGRLANLVGSIHFWEPSAAIEIYDLGLSPISRNEIATWRHTTLLRLPFESLPPHFRDLRRTYSFKPWGLYEALQRADHVLWIDANMELRQPIDDIRHILQTHGVFYTIQRQRFPNTRFHSMETIQRFNCSAPFYSRHQVPAGLQGYTRGSWAYTHVLEPLLACAMENDCIAPPGTNRSNHRQDQTVLNSLLCALDVNSSLIQEDLKFWLSSHVDDLREPLQPTADPTSKNDVVIYTRREHPWKPYTPFLVLPKSMAGESRAVNDTTASLRAILERESLVQMQSLLLGLTVDDLEALAKFPTHPHRSVHLLMAMVYLILHESAVQNDCLPPSMVQLTWAFLRETLLRNCAALFLRLQRRRFHHPVHPTITHVCMLYLQDPAFRIQALRKVSAIAAALASWVVLCLQASVPRSLADPDKPEQPHTTRSVPSRPSLRFVLRLHGRLFLCLVRSSSHDATIDVCDATTFHRTTVRRRDCAFDDLFRHTLPPPAFRTWLQHVLNASFVDCREDIQLPHLLPVYFVVVCPPFVVGVGVVLVTPTMSLRQCRRAVESRYGSSDMVMYHRRSPVSAVMETKLDARAILPVALLSPRDTNHHLMAPALNLVDHISHSPLAVYRQVNSASVTTLPHVTLCPMHRSLLDIALVMQLTSLLGLWAAHGHECVAETCAQNIPSHDASRVESSASDGAGKGPSCPGRRTQIPSPPKQRPYAAELRALAVQLHLFTEEDVLPDEDKASKKRTTRCVPLHVCVSVEWTEVSATTERYTCHVLFDALDPTTTLRDVFAKGADLRLADSSQVTIESGWVDDVRTFDICRPAGAKPLPPMSSVWLMVDAQDDKRPQWLHDIQAFVTHPMVDFNGSSQCYKYFGVSLPLHVPEQLVEGTLWSRHVDWHAIVSKTPCDALVDAKFHELCASYPANIYIDSVKFSKFIRDCHVLPSMLAMGSLDGIFHRFALLRFQMDLEGFRAAIALVVHHVTRSHRNGTMAPLLYFFLHFMILSPSMRGNWDQTMESYRMEAKMHAMDVLARQICAATRVQARHHWAMIRRRRQAATTIVSCFKMLHCMRQFKDMQRVAAMERAWELARLEKRRREEAERAFVVTCQVRLQVWVKYRLWKKRRFRARCPEWNAHIQRLRTRKRLLMSRLAYRIGGNLMLVSVFRSHIDQSKNSQLHLEVYQPSDSRTYTFDVHEGALQDIWAAVVDHDKPDPSKLRSRLEGLLRRLYVNTAVHRVKMHASDDRCGRGRLLQRLGCRLHETTWIASVFLRHSHVDVLLYAPSTSRATKHELDMAFVQSVLEMAHPSRSTPSSVCCGVAVESTYRDEISCRRFVAQAFECEAHEVARSHLRVLIRYVAVHGSTTPAPALFQPAKPVQDTKQPRAIRRMYSIEDRYNASTRLQAVWMGFRTRQAVATMLQANFAISFDPTAGHVWFQSHTTGHCFASPPLRRFISVTYPPPPNEWLPQDDDHGRVYFFNPSRGVASWFNLDTAALKVQRAYRHRRHAAIGRLTMQHLAKAVAYHHLIGGSNRVTPDTSSVDIERMALHHHTLTHNFSKAIALYEQLLENYPSHEVVASTCLAILLLATGRAPLKKNAARASALLKTAKRMDKSLAAVKALELTCFRWAVLVAPNDAIAMANYALFAEVVLDDIDKAELLYRRALAQDSGHTVTVENYANLVKERTPHGRYATAGPGRVALQRACIVATVGPWHQLRDSHNNTTFWSNFKTKQVQWDPPEGSTPT
ncbi:hypothetical protein, variant 4 [Aphanomyces invadans]|uniref:WW domain-containing protein n=1 Tax=Aphanomyces invadans TaxID=157072 RepID=A0A024UT62_9STRA|nr:hypothetical protein, variant 3 [Aphanomyces invadans]XP_008861115.1 hypothetical protein, variant 4 [Aphanomyces invadans]ETW09705.1 hypothetical protein, variant 3 [Aphanomyces invadans]ETW09706.1 hypothetical protein, variant 4 [Aphanomyces invadans]|eukprot:XP_008861114.1 hypothetical protein, variant 3 [Aphanomyces invadans]